MCQNRTPEYPVNTPSSHHLYAGAMPEQLRVSKTVGGGQGMRGSDGKRCGLTGRRAQALRPRLRSIAGPRGVLGAPPAIGQHAGRVRGEV